MMISVYIYIFIPCHIYGWIKYKSLRVFVVQKQYTQPVSPRESYE